MEPNGTTFTPISPNPFIVGNPVRDRSLFFGRQAEFELVRRRFQHSRRGGLLVFCGERRSGKTSILFQIIDGRLGPDFLPVLIDMQSMAIADETDFFLKIVGEIRNALPRDADGARLPAFDPGSKPAAAFQRFIEQILLLNPTRRPILLFDEYELFENKIADRVLSEDVLYVFSSLMENHPVFLVFTGSQHLEQRREEYWRILGKSIYRQISYLEREDALKLIRKPVEGRVEYGEGTVESIYRLTAGQPFYTQAVCQNLVDRLNECRTTRATEDVLAGVVGAMIDNPLPQMIFLWDGLESDEKVVMALLAEALRGPETFASARDLHRTRNQVRYPLSIDVNRIALALENMFQRELLLKNEEDTPGYAFRMDLWRQWVRRMHSVWQVIREEGLDAGPSAGEPGSSRGGVLGWSPARLLWSVLITAFLLSIGVLLLLNFASDRRQSYEPLVAAQPPKLPPPSVLQLSVSERSARLFHGDSLLGTGRVDLEWEQGVQDYPVRVSHEDYFDSSFAISLRPGERRTATVVLRPRQGTMRVTTEPQGAAVTIDGNARGASPVTVVGLALPDTHRIEAKASGFEPVLIRVKLSEHEISGDMGGAVGGVELEDSVGVVHLVLQPRTGDIFVTTTPTSAVLRIDGENRGTTPVKVERLAFGPHRVEVSRAGYLVADTLLAVAEEIVQLHLLLAPEPPGVLVVQGDHPARIYLDGSMVTEYVQFSGPLELAPGRHDLTVELVSGETVECSIDIVSGRQITYDYSQERVVDQIPIKEGKP